MTNFYNQTNYAKLHKNPPAPTESVDIITHAEDSCTLETIDGMKERLANQARQIVKMTEDFKTIEREYDKLWDESYEYKGRYNHAGIILEAKTEQLNDYIEWLDEQKAETTKYKQLAMYYKQIANCLDDGLEE